MPWANWRISADLAVPGGPKRNRCSRATIARAMRSMTSSRPTKRCLSGSITVRRTFSTTAPFSECISFTLCLLVPVDQLCGILAQLGPDQHQVRYAESARNPRRFETLRQPLGIQEEQSAMAAEVEVPQRSVRQIGAHTA